MGDHKQNGWWQRWRRLLLGGDGEPERVDPEEMLNLAMQEMRDLHARHRERAVQAITQKNHLQQMVQDLQQRITLLYEKADTAEKHGSTEAAWELREEARRYQETLDSTQASLIKAEAVCEEMKAHVQQEEGRIRAKVAEILALKAQWQQIEIEDALTRALTAEEETVLEQRRLPRAQLLARHEQNRQRAQLALESREQLERAVSEGERRVEDVQENLELARRRGDERREMTLLRELEQYEAQLAGVREQLERATLIAKRVTTLVESEADWLRRNEELLTYDDAPWERAAAEDEYEDREPTDSQERDAAWILWFVAAFVLLVTVVILVLLLKA